MAKENSFEDLKFIESEIDEYNLENTDIIIALHACDTATDDAMAKGLKANAELIIIAPCCQRELRNKIKVPSNLQPVLRYPTLLEREIEILTNSIRSLFLESKGYKVKVFEFTSLEHTGRNIMIVGNKNKEIKRGKVFTDKINQIKKDFQIKSLYLDEVFK